MRYCTASRTGFTPSSMSRSNSDWLRPARAAALFRMTGPSWQWSPTRMSCGKVGCKSKNGRLVGGGRWGVQLAVVTDEDELHSKLAGHGPLVGGWRQKHTALRCWLGTQASPCLLEPLQMPHTSNRMPGKKNARQEECSAHLLGAHHQGNHGLRLNRLGGLVNQPAKEPIGVLFEKSGLQRHQVRAEGGEEGCSTAWVASSISLPRNKRA